LVFFAQQWQDYAEAEVAIVGLEADRHRLNIAKQYGCEAIVGMLPNGQNEEMDWAQISSLMQQAQASH